MSFRVNCRLAFLLTAYLAISTEGSPHRQQPSADRERARVQFQSTLERFRRDHNSNAARKGYLECIKIDPSYPAPGFNLAMLAEADENWVEAISRLEDYRKLDAKSDTSIRAGVEIERLMAVRELDKTPEGKRKRRYETAIARAQRLTSLRLNKAAVLEADAAVKIDPARFEAYAVVGAAQARERRFEQAAVTLQLAIDRADAKTKLKLTAAKEACLKEAHYASLGQQGAAALQIGRYAEAAQLFSEGRQLFPDRGTYGLAAALAWIDAKKQDKAKEILGELARSTDPLTVGKANRILARLGEITTPGVPTGAK